MTAQTLPVPGVSRRGLIRPSSSSSEITMTPWFGPLLLLVLAWGRTGAILVGSSFGRRVAIHSAEPCLLSSVCHWPSASTMTSSAISGVESRMLPKYLRDGQCTLWRNVNRSTYPSSISSPGSNTFSQIGQSHVVICSIMVYHDVASKH